MFETVLVPTDFSKYAQKVPECIAQMPGVKNMVLMNVVARDPLARTWDPVAERREAREKLEERAKTLNLPGIDIKVREELDLEGSVPGLIQKVAEEEGASLIAMGARGRGTIESILLGSVTRGVLKYGDKDLLIMRYRELERSGLQEFCARLFEKVLFPTDFSEPARSAIAKVTGIPGVRDIVLLHVVSSGETKEEIDSRVQDASNAIKAMAEGQGIKGLNVTTNVAVGNPVREINSVAEKENVSLIAMSSIGRNSPSKAMIGSVAYDVAHNAERPVLVIRSKR